MSNGCECSTLNLLIKCEALTLCAMLWQHIYHILVDGFSIENVRAILIHSYMFWNHVHSKVGCEYCCRIVKTPITLEEE